MRSLLLVVGILSSIGSLGLRAQTHLLGPARMIDKTTQRSISLSQPSGLSSSVKLIFPTTPGSVGDALYASSTSGNDVSLAWARTVDVTSGAGTARLSASQTTTAIGTPTSGLSISLSGNRVYRFEATIGANRDEPGGAASTKVDVFRIRVTPPTGSSYCAAGIWAITQNTTTATVGVPSFGSNQSDAAIVTGNIDPAGSGTKDYTTYVYRVEGIVVVGASSGNLTIQLLQETPAGSQTNNLTLVQESNIVAREIR